MTEKSRASSREVCAYIKAHDTWTGMKWASLPLPWAQDLPAWPHTLLQGVTLDSTAHSYLLATFLGIESLGEFSANEFFDHVKEFALKPGKLRAWSPTGAAAGRWLGYEGANLIDGQSIELDISKRGLVGRSCWRCRFERYFLFFPVSLHFLTAMRHTAPTMTVFPASGSMQQRQPWA